MTAPNYDPDMHLIKDRIVGNREPAKRAWAME